MRKSEMKTTKVHGRRALTDGVTSCDDIDIGDRAKRQDGDDRPQGTAGLVDVGEDLSMKIARCERRLPRKLGGRATHLRGITSFGQGSQRAATRVNAGKTDGEHTDADGCVDEVCEIVSRRQLREMKQKMT
jgi:hypothetical protein